jgi:ketosteroid isomerase-like protein
MEATETLMRQIVEAFETGDLRPLFDAIDEENIVWKSGSTNVGPFRFGGVYAKREGIVEVTSQIASKYKFRHYVPKEIIAKGDIVWGLFQVSGDFRLHGENSVTRPFEFECAIRWRVRDKKIIEHQAFFDTYALFKQLEGADGQSGKF